MKIKWQQAVIAGVVGTLVFDVIGFILTGQWWDIPALLGEKLGIGILGVVVHYGNGVILAILFAAMAPSLWGPIWLRALTFITLETIFGVFLFMMPLLGAGVGGLALGATFPVIALLRHWGYGLALALLYPSRSSIPETMQAAA